MNEMVADGAEHRVTSLRAAASARRHGGTSLATVVPRGPQPTAVIEEVLAVLNHADPFAALADRCAARRSAEIDRFEALPLRLRGSRTHLHEHRRNLLAISATAAAAERVLLLFREAGRGH